MIGEYCYIFKGNPWNFQKIDKNLWELQDEIIYDYCGRKVTIPRGFQYDLASVPKVFQGILGSKEELAIEACLLHDFCYRVNVLRRKDADLAFLLLMERYNNPKSGWKRKLMYWAVHFFGKKPYNLKS